jgi:hypothetical protein
MRHGEGKATVIVVPATTATLIGEENVMASSMSAASLSDAQVHADPPPPQAARASKTMPATTPRTVATAAEGDLIFMAFPEKRCSQERHERGGHLVPMSPHCSGNIFQLG